MEWNEILYMGGERSSNRINRFDTRFKILFLIGSISLILLTGSPFVPLYYALVSLVLVYFADVSLRQFVARLMAPAIVVSTLIVIQAFFYGNTPYYEVPVPFIDPVIYTEGLARGGLLTLRVIGGVSLIILLSLTSSILSILSALKYFRVPRSWLEIMFLSYRYLFVFLSHLTTTYQAQKFRLGYETAGSALGSFTTLGEHLFLHIFDQTSRTFEAMKLRGYKGFLPIPRVWGEYSATSITVCVCLFLPGVGLAWL